MAGPRTDASTDNAQAAFESASAGDGDSVAVLRGELPVFWACGVTPQVAIESARPELCITHAPGAMLVTDARNSALASC